MPAAAGSFTHPCRAKADPRTYAGKGRIHGPAPAKGNSRTHADKGRTHGPAPAKDRPTDPRRQRADPRTHTGQGRIHGPMPAKGRLFSDAKRRAHGLAMNAAFFRFVSSFRRRGRALPISPDGPGSYRFPSRRQWLPRCPYPGRPAAFLRTWDRSRPNLWP